jgi:hypothetical protein
LGYEFRKDWLYLSLISIPWKFEMANVLPRIALARRMGLDVDPYESIAPRRGVVDLARLQESLGLSTELLRAALIDTNGRHRYNGVFRYCRSCLAPGYHHVVPLIELSVVRVVPHLIADRRVATGSLIFRIGATLR